MTKFVASSTAQAATARVRVNNWAWRAALLAAAAVATAAYVASKQPIPQPLGHVEFVDGRTLTRVPGALNVFSNAELSIVGIAGPTLSPR